MAELLAATFLAVCIALVSRPLCALQLSGVLLYAADENGQPVGPVWHTASGFGGRPLGFTRWPPPQTRGIPFPQAADGSLSIDLWPAPLVAAHVTHLFWQFLPGEFPTALVLNLYFNGDPTRPGISAWVPWRYGFTHQLPNPALNTLSLTLDSVDNPASLEFSDGELRARLTAAFYFPSDGEPKQWRPLDFTRIDRVGIDSLRPDGRPDGVLVFELKVEADPAAAAGRWQPPWRRSRPSSPPAREPAWVSIGPELTPPSPEKASTPLPIGKGSPFPSPPTAETESSPQGETTPEETPSAPASEESASPVAVTPSPDASTRPTTPTPHRTLERTENQSSPKSTPPTPSASTPTPKGGDSPPPLVSPTVPRTGSREKPDS
jgi:hypothetical protein